MITSPGGVSTSLTRRRTTFGSLRSNPQVDVLVVGGGINGAGTFRDLALQGVHVLLVEQNDFCSGASAASSRMIHGGLRYLEFGEFRLVNEALHERNRLLQNAPHYVHPLPTTIPVRAWFSGVMSCVLRFLRLGGHRPADRGAVMVKIGLTFYDLFTRKSRLMPRHHFQSRKSALQRRPSLTSDLLCTATYFDAWVSYPERLCLEVIADGVASSESAWALNYVSLQGASGAEVHLRDEPTGETLRVRPRVLINASGAWIDLANAATGRRTALIGGTKGAHLVVDNPDLLRALDGEMVYFENEDGRPAVALPWLGKALIGSTDIPVENPDQARCEADEVEYILHAMKRVFPGIDITPEQIVSHFSGVRPLPKSNAKHPSQVSRDHHCIVIEPSDVLQVPVFCMVGGKWTSFRAFSEQVTDLALKRLGRRRKLSTERIAIGGGRDFPRTADERQAWLKDAGSRTGVNEERLAVLLDRYGTRALDVATYLAQGKDGPLAHHGSYTRREIEFLTDTEAVVHLHDLILRRTSMALLGEVTMPLLEELAQIAAATCGWSDERTKEEIDRTVILLRERYGVRFDAEQHGDS